MRKRGVPRAATAPRDGVRQFVEVSSALIRRDAALVAAMAVVVTLSAFAVFQATRAADEADEVLGQAQVLQTQLDRQSAYEDSLVQHDLSVLGAYCGYAVERDVAAVSALTDTPDTASLVRGTLSMQALDPLIVGDTSTQCATDPGDPTSSYSLREVQQAHRPQLSVQGGAVEGVSGLTTDAIGFGDRERGLMLAGLLYAVALAALIAVDALDSRDSRPGRLGARLVRRLQQAAVAVAAVAAAAGSVLLIRDVVDGAMLAGLLVLLLLAVVGRRLALHRTGKGRVRLPAWGRPQWWSQVIGAVTLVAFSAAALAFSHVSTQEREESAVADQLSVAAQRLQIEGQQQALGDLSAAALVLQARAGQAATAQADLRDDAAGQADTASGDAQLAETDRQLQELEAAIQAQEVVESVDLQPGQALVSACPSAASSGTDSAEAVPPESPGVLADLLTSPDQVTWQLSSVQQPTRACDVVTELTRANARVWAQDGSTLSVALVVLGLAGFMLALGADPDRSARSARSLLGIGAVGTVVGLVLGTSTAPDIVWRDGLATPQQRVAFADDVAAAMTDCLQFDAVDRAVLSLPGHGPSYQTRAFSAVCTPPVPAMITSAVPSTVRLNTAITDLRTADRLGPSTAGLRGNLGWLLLLRGTQDGGSDGLADLREGLALTDGVIAEYEAHPQDAPVSLHQLRYNRALALAALDEDDVAARAAYLESTRCLDPAAECLGGGVEDGALRDEIALWALADLELLEPSLRDESFMLAVLEELSGGPAGGEDELESAPELFVYPQELAVSRAATDDLSTSIVWYYRPDAAAPWSVVLPPSLATVHPGAHTGRPYAVGPEVFFGLPSGDYRADVYAAGARTEVTLAYTAREGVARRASSKLGVSAVVPQEWAVHVDDGVEWAVGPTWGEGVTVRRMEAVSGPDDMDALTPYLRGLLDDWLATTWSDLEDPAEETEGDWVLGVSETLTQQRPDVAAITMAAYESAALGGPACGGTAFLVSVGGEGVDPELTGYLWNTVVLDRPAERVASLKGQVSEATFALELPDWWDGTVLPPGGAGDLLSAQDCTDKSANLLLNQEVSELTAQEKVDATLEDFADPAEFPEFELQSRRTVSVPGADSAEVIDYTWLPSGRDDTVWQRQVYASDGERLTFMTLTTTSGALSDFYIPFFDEIEASLTLP